MKIQIQDATKQLASAEERQTETARSTADQIVRIKCTTADQIAAAESRAEAAAAELVKSQQKLNELLSGEEAQAAEITALQKTIDDDREKSASSIEWLQGANARLQRSSDDAEKKLKEVTERLAEAESREQAALQDLAMAKESEGKSLGAKREQVLIDFMCFRTSSYRKRSEDRDSGGRQDSIAVSLRLCHQGTARCHALA